LNANSWAKKAGIRESAIRNFLAGRSSSLNFRTCEKLAAAAHSTPSDMFSNDAKPNDTYTGLKIIPEIDVRAGMGGGGEGAVTYVSDGDGGFMETDAVCENWSIPEDYLRSELRVKVDAARIIEVQGDSMTPTLISGDRIMINTDDKRPSPPGIFAIWDGFGVVVKRIEHIPNSDPPTLRIKSDNQQHNTYERTFGEVNIIGRVVWRALRV
jgi:hypothetical protein